MARPEITGRKPLRGNVPTDVDAFSIPEFCERYRISCQLFFKLRRLGLMPATFNVGSRVLISRESAEAWRREREQAAQLTSVTAS